VLYRRCRSLALRLPAQVTPLAAPGPLRPHLHFLSQRACLEWFPPSPDHYSADSSSSRCRPTTTSPCPPITSPLGSPLGARHHAPSPFPVTTRLSIAKPSLKPTTSILFMKCGNGSPRPYRRRRREAPSHHPPIQERWWWSKSSLLGVRRRSRQRPASCP
jgi:hypothetical protein